jgi:uracil-DNA glycosylase
MTWNEILGPVLASAKMSEVKQFIKEGRLIKNIYPDGKSVFRAFDMCPYDDTKVVILGQDPYATAGTADGLAFSSATTIPGSLQIIFKEIYRDLNIQYFHNITFEEFFPNGDLTNWTKMGFLLLNTALTVEEGKPGSHKDIGWERVTDAVFDALNKKNNQIIFLLWGNEAKEYEKLVKNPKHICLTAPHPAAELHNPDGPRFSGCRHFSIVRDILATLWHSNDLRSVNLDSCFSKEEAIKIVKEHYPIEADKLIEYIKRDLFINIPVNKENYFSKLREIEKGFSTFIIGFSTKPIIK